MLDRRRFLIALSVLSSLACAQTAKAGDRMAYTPQAFEDAQKAGKPILVDISASWCPICKAQKQVLAKLLPSAAYADIAVFEVDFDAQKDVVRAFGARMQSTLITFKGKKEVGRLVGVTKADAIKRLLDSTS
ncbi:thioredoxin [Mesorhizobium sp. M3A.F.Ca.ET.174.01.1.1]|nr:MULTISPECIES: thioredoxin family protein [unclassified Mesorhizobium]TGT57264.1 thioredoxin [Mesorhizobium sp. M00.F.Ca.ET.170.01.1.1]AZO11982.1 thioredoxin [Mesorhizobium sp. M3A.F.Ca.ET.080.04.2.1]PBB86121.1 thiol reductase thioredoxin [Mesorhizobium sp. WSM3876]RWB66729.1 MAG: thioredoxin [Mesorhizobium sp.]RWB90679.1 MAG: thioredoxin [Mesorhizobium sp.]